MALRYYANGPAHYTSATIADSTTTSIQMDSISGWPTQFPFTIILDPGGVLEEACDVTSILGTTLTVVRGTDSTLASAHAAGIKVVHGVTARDIRESNTHINSTANVHGTTGSLVDTGAVQTITGQKNFTGGLQRAGSEVVDTGANQTINGTKTFSIIPTTTTQGSLVAVGKTGGNNFVTDNNFNGGTSVNLTSNVTQSHTGPETHSGTMNLNGPVNFGSAGACNVNAPAAFTSTVTSSQAISAPGQIVSLAYSGTTDANGFVTITHGQSFTPVGGWAVTTNPSSSFALFWGIDTIGATTVRLRFMNASVAGPLNTLGVSGRLFLVRP